jgi:hypothetical protein
VLPLLLLLPLLPLLLLPAALRHPALLLLFRKSRSASGCG